MYESATLDSTLDILENQPVGLVICGDLLNRAGWRDVYRELESRSGAPSFIACAEKPDVMLWADVLHCGGYAVLHLPLMRDEVLRTCWLAWMSQQSAIASAPCRGPVPDRRARYESASSITPASAAA